MTNDLPQWVFKLIRNANFGDGGDGGGGDGGGEGDAGDAGGGGAGASSGDAPGGSGGDGSSGATGADAAGAAGGDAGLGGAGAAADTSSSTGGFGATGDSATSASDASAAAAASSSAGSPGIGGAASDTAAGGLGAFGASVGGAPGAALGFASDPGDPFGVDPGGLGFGTLGGPNPMDPGSPGFSQPMSSQGDFLAGGVAPSDPGAFTGLGPGTVGSNAGFGFGDTTGAFNLGGGFVDASPGALTFGDPTAVDPTADMAAQGWPVGTVGAPPVATQADLDQLANPGTGLPIGTQPTVSNAPTDQQLSNAFPGYTGGGGINLGGGPGPTDIGAVTTDTQGGVSGGGAINPLGLGVLSAGAGSPLARIFTGTEGGVQLASGEVVPEPSDVNQGQGLFGSDQTLTADQIVQQQQQIDALLAQWAQIIPPTDPRWPQVLQFVQQQVGQPFGNLFAAA